MKTTLRLKDNSIKGLMIFSLFTILTVKSCMVMAQSGNFGSVAHYNKYSKSVAKRSYARGYNHYTGYELSVGLPTSKLSSDIPQLSNLNTQYIGINAGGVISNSFSKVKATAGYYYSTSAVPYEIDLIQGNISANLYALKLINGKHHWIEPYANVSLTQRQSRFFGYYLEKDPGINRSTANLPFMGKNWQTYVNIGSGVEFQLINDNHQVVQLFVEGGYGMRVRGTSKDVFSNTRGNSQGYVTLGLNLGILKH